MISDIRLLPSATRTILHLDADSFFVGCEQALNPKLRGKPVITGGERGVVTAASREAKRLGVTRGMPTWQVKRNFPQVIICRSNFGAYGLFSQRIFSIIRRYSPTVEEYSIDEAFADLTGLRRPLNMSYKQIGQQIQIDVERELNLSVSVGIGASKVLAKVASKWNKPHGLVYIRHGEIPFYLSKTKIANIWGIGPQTAGYLNQRGIESALQFIEQSDTWVNSFLSKPYQEIWLELKGVAVLKVDPNPKGDYDSISKTKTFYPYTSDPSLLFAQLVRNLEGALFKSRRYQLAPQLIAIFLKTHHRDGYFQKKFSEVKLSRPSPLTQELVPILRQMFNQIFDQRLVYRATGVVLNHLSEDQCDQLDLFSDPLKIISLRKLENSVDQVKNKYGRQIIHTASSLLAQPSKAPSLYSLPLGECR